MIVKKSQSALLKAAFVLGLFVCAGFVFWEKEQRTIFDEINTKAASEDEQGVFLQESSARKPESSQTDSAISPNVSSKNKIFHRNRANDSQQTPPADPAQFEKWAITSLRTQFGKNIQSKSRQAELLGLRAYMMKRFPQDWQARLYNVFSSAFPENADSIFETFAEFDIYNQWFEDNASFIGSLDYETIKAQLNRKRSEIFGEAAAELWPPESKNRPPDN